MELQIERDVRLPPLAFAVRLGADGVARAVVGAMVATGDGWLCDGAWAGDLRDGRFDRYPLFGTGVRAEPNRLVVVGSSTMHERAVIMRIDREVLVSNSLPLLLALADDRLDPADPDYRNRYVAMEHGLDIAPRSHGTLEGRRFELVTGETLRISADLTIERRPDGPHAPFRSYAAYVGELREVTQAVFANAADPARPHRFEPMATLSAGYDSVAAAAVARDAGATEAFTLVRPRPGEPGVRDDDARPAAAALGLRLHDVERDGWRDRTDLPEADHAASLGTMGGVVMIASEAVVAGRLRVSGLMGDVLWSTTNHRAHRTFVHSGGVMSGRATCEARLRVGYIDLPVPGIGASAHRSIAAITRSDEMARWRLGGSYDRPIARRLGEEAGVPREAFGQRKFGGSAKVGNRAEVLRYRTREAARTDLLEVMTPDGASAFLQFLDGLEPAGSLAGPPRDLGASLYQKLDALDVRSSRALARVGVPGVVPRRVLAALARRARLPYSYTDFMPHWGTAVLAERYRTVAQEFRAGSGGAVDER